MYFINRIGYESGFFWKQMRSRTYVSKNEKAAAGFKAAKDRLMLLFCVKCKETYV